MSEEPRLRRDPKLPFQEIGGEVVIVAPSRREMHQLDEVGAFLWKELEKPRSAGELADAVCGEFEVERDRAGKDVRAFLAELGEKGLVLPA